MLFVDLKSLFLVYIDLNKINLYNKNIINE